VQLKVEERIEPPPWELKGALELRNLGTKEISPMNTSPPAAGTRRAVATRGGALTRDGQVSHLQEVPVVFKIQEPTEEEPRSLVEALTGSDAEAVRAELGSMEKLQVRSWMKLPARMSWKDTKIKERGLSSTQTESTA
jgi:hypothetical protein